MKKETTTTLWVLDAGLPTREEMRIAGEDYCPGDDSGVWPIQLAFFDGMCKMDDIARPIIVKTRRELEDVRWVKNDAIRLLRDLRDLQNGAPLEQHRKEWEEVMTQIDEFFGEKEKGGEG